MKNCFASRVKQIHKQCSHSRLFEASHAFPVCLIVPSAARCWRPGVWLQSPAIWLQSPVVWRQRWRRCWCHGTLWISAATAADCGSGLWALTVVRAWLRRRKKHVSQGWYVCSFTSLLHHTTRLLTVSYYGKRVKVHPKAKTTTTKILS